jgi:hypothetical protein
VGAGGFVGAGGTIEPTVFFTHVPVVGLRTCPTGHTVTADAEAAVRAPPRARASALAVTTPVRRTVVLGDMRKSLRGRRFWAVDGRNDCVPAG